MRVFLSWSGERSKRVAQALREWLPLVLQTCEPWMSEQDIKAGQQWAKEIGSQLGATKFGIVCVTAENIGASWLNFEAGALSKQVEGTEPRVAGYLLGLKAGQVEGPLSLYQLKEAERDGTLGVLRSVNGAMEKPLAAAVLEQTFETWWPKLEEKLRAVPPPVAGTPPQRSADDMLEEVVETVRRIEGQLTLTTAQRIVRGIGEEPETIPYIPSTVEFANAIRRQMAAASAQASAPEPPASPEKEST